MGVDLESLSEATSGAIGSLLSTTILYPLDTCKTKYQAEVQAHGQQKYRWPLFLFFHFYIYVFNSGFILFCCDHDPRNSEFGFFVFWYVNLCWISLFVNMTSVVLFAVLFDKWGWKNQSHIFLI